MEALQAVCLDTREADAVLFGARWILMRDPEKGRRCPPSSLWSLRVRPPGRDVRMLLYYTFTESEVVFITITPEPL